MRDGSALRGVMLAIMATLAFAGSDILTKQLTAVHALSLVVAVRYAVNLGLLALVFGPREGAGLWRIQRTWLVLLRGLCLSAATLTVVLALRLLPVAETVAIIYLAPFAVLVLSGPLLNERVSAWGWLGAAVGFGGVLLILRPGGGLDPLGVVFALVNTGFATAYHLLTRVLTRTETTAAMLFHTALVGTVIFGATTLAAPPAAMPGWIDLATMVMLGVLATGGHMLFTVAYVAAPAGLVAPVGYVHLVWAAILGWLVFGHWPTDLSLLGMALVIAAGVLTAWQARRG